MKHVFLGALLLLTGPQSAPRSAAPPASPSSSPPGLNFFSPQQDIEIGTVSAEEAQKTLSIVRSIHLNQYVRSIAQRLLTAVPSRQVQYQFRIVNSNEVSSLAFPNGAVFIYRGLLSIASTDDEIAAILAHEIGHVASRHATSQLSRQLLVQAPISISAGLPTTGAWKDQLGRLGVEFGVNAPFLHYSSDQEVQATAAAARILAAARFDPLAVDAVFQKASETWRASDAPIPMFLFNHPMIPKKEPDPESVKPPVRPVRTSPEFRAFHAALKKIPQPPVEVDIPDSTTNDELPNTFVHPLNYYRLNYPDGWEVTRTLNGAIITAPNGVRTSTAGDDVTYGLMVDMFELSDKRLTLEQATNRLIVYLRQRNQTVRVVPGATTPTFIQNEPGLRTVLLRGGLIRSGNANVTEPSEVLWLVTRRYYENLFYMVFVASEEDFPSQQAVFEQIMRSVQIR